MPNIPSSVGFLSKLLGRPIVAAIAASVVTGLVVLVACFMVWYHFGGGAWGSWKSVEEAQLVEPDMLRLKVYSCEGRPGFSELRETEVDVQVKLYVLFHFNTSLRMLGGPPAACEAHVEIPLREPLGDRVVIDLHTGQTVSVTRAYR